MSKKITPTKPLLIMLYGFPGSGKTYFAQNLSENLHAAHVHGDRIRWELFDEPQYDKQENHIIQQLMDYMTEEFLSAGISVIYDVNAMRKSQRFALRDLARKKHAKPLVVWFQMDADTAYARLKNRDRRKSEDKYAIPYSENLFNKIITHMQPPKNDEDYVVVSGKHTYNSQQTSTFKKMLELGYIDPLSTQTKVVMPGLINIIPRQNPGRFDASRRNIHIR